MMRQPLANYIKMARHSEALLADEKVKGAMKSGTTGKKMGPLRTLPAFHADGSDLALKAIVSAVVVRGGGGRGAEMCKGWC